MAIFYACFALSMMVFVAPIITWAIFAVCSPQKTDVPAEQGWDLTAQDMGAYDTPEEAFAAASKDYRAYKKLARAIARRNHSAISRHGWMLFCSRLWWEKNMGAYPVLKSTTPVQPKLAIATKARWATLLFILAVCAVMGDEAGFLGLAAAVNPVDQLRAMLPKPGPKTCYREVVQVSVPEGAEVAEGTPYGFVQVELVARPEGLTGAARLASDLSADDLKKVVALDAEGNPRPIEDWEVSTMARDVLPIELADDEQAMSEERKAQLARVIARVAIRNKAIAYQGANSAALIRTHHTGGRLDGCQTALAALISALGGTEGCDTVNIQQYVLSVLNAAVMRKLAKPEEDIVFAAYDFSKPIGHLDLGAQKVQVFLSDAGTDGGGLFSASIGCTKNPQKLVSGQGRAVVINVSSDKSWAGGILKGMWHAAEIQAVRCQKTGKALIALKVELPSLGKKVFVPSGEADKAGTLYHSWKAVARDYEVKNLGLNDLNLFKAGAKQMPAYKAAEASNAPGAIHVFEDAVVRFHFIQTVKTTGAGDFEKLAASFQETVWTNDFTRVSNDMGDEIVRQISNVTDERHKEALEAFAASVQDRLGVESGTVVSNGKVLSESPNTVISRMASSGTTRKVKTGKVRGNKVLLAGMVLVADHFQPHLPNGDLDELLFHRPVAQKRTPQVVPFCLTTSVSLSYELLEILVTNLLAGRIDAPLGEVLSETHWGTAVYKDRTWRQFLEAIVSKHNERVGTAGYKGEVTYDLTESTSLEELKKRFLELYLSVSSVTSWNGVFFANPLDGRDRQEDHDGDSSAVDGDRYWVNLYAQAEKHWNKLPRVNVELPKGSKMSWRDLGLGQVLNQGGPKEVNVKGMYLFEAVPQVDAYDDEDRIVNILGVTMANPQGPVGLFSNVAADLFAHIHWEENSGDLKPATAGDEGIYKAWIIAAASVQLAIDWQKRAYKLFNIEDWRGVAELFIAKGADGITAEDLSKVTGGKHADLKTKSKIGRKMFLTLGANWCFNPELVYPWAKSIVGHKPCVWKQRKDGKFAPSVEITNMLDMGYNRDYDFYKVMTAAHGKDGWLKDANAPQEALDAWANSLYLAMMAKIAGNAPLEAWVKKVKAALPQALREVLILNQEIPEDSKAMAKMGPRLRGKTLLACLGFTPEQQKELAEGQGVLIEGGAVRADVLMILAACCAPTKRKQQYDMLPYQIILGWWVSEQVKYNATTALMELSEKVCNSLLDKYNQYATGSTSLMPRSPKVASTSGLPRDLPDEVKGVIKYFHKTGECAFNRLMALLAWQIESKWDDQKSWASVEPHVTDDMLAELLVEVDDDMAEAVIVYKAAMKRLFDLYRTAKLMGAMPTNKSINGRSLSVMRAGGSFEAWQLCREGSASHQSVYAHLGGATPGSFAADERKHNQLCYLDQTVTDVGALTFEWRQGRAILPSLGHVANMALIEDLWEHGFYVKSHSTLGKTNGYLAQDEYEFIWGAAAGRERPEHFLCVDENLEFYHDRLNPFDAMNIMRGIGAAPDTAHLTSKKNGLVPQAAWVSSCNKAGGDFFLDDTFVDFGQELNEILEERWGMIFTAPVALKKVFWTDLLKAEVARAVLPLFPQDISELEDPARRAEIAGLQRTAALDAIGRYSEFASTLGDDVYGEIITKLPTYGAQSYFILNKDQTLNQYKVYQLLTRLLVCKGRMRLWSTLGQ